MNEANSTPNFISSADTLPTSKVYSPPIILYELELETRAGTPLAPEGIDPLGLNNPATFP
ncbi:MAG: hypothetical protein Fur0022_34960 [Anaerolineales bacterium]